MTEDEAKQKWCPMFREQAPANEWNNNRCQSHCIASGCMMWRWTAERRYPDLNGAPDFRPESAKPVKGYCGLGGKP